MTPRHPSRVAEEWAKYHAENPHVYQMFRRFAAEAKAAGLRRFSADAILHRMRWFTAIEARGDGFKLNNNHASFYARQLIADDPTSADFFQLRRPPRRAGA